MTDTFTTLQTLVHQKSREMGEQDRYIASLEAKLARLKNPDDALVEAVGAALAKPRQRVSHVRSDKAADAVIAILAIATALEAEQTENRNAE